MCSAYVELLTPEQATPDNPTWHVLRRGAVTASEIAAVLGISPWESPFSLYWSKVHGWTIPDSPEMAAGRRAEPIVADWFAEQGDPLGNLAVRPAGLYASKERPWQLATPDRMVHLRCDECDADLDGDPWGTACPACWGRGYQDDPAAALECKYVIGSWDGWGPDGSDEIPVHYRAQALWQLDTLGVDTTYVAAWHGAELRIYPINRDERDLRVMRTAAEMFLARIAANEAPPIDGHSATVQTLKALHPSIEDRDIEVPAEFAEGYRRARQLARRTENVLDRYEARARELLGNGRRLLCNGHLVCSRSIYDQSGSMVELDSLDADPPTVDRLNPGRATSYLTPKGKK
jgi:putative phage-type endonuclease